MTKIYVLTSGECSDYSIDGVFSTEELAEKARITLGEHHYDIEEYELDELMTIVDHIEHGYKMFVVSMDLDSGYVSKAEEDEYGGIREYEFPSITSNKYAVRVLAKSQGHAMKIANEKRIQYIAQNNIAV